MELEAEFDRFGEDLVAFIHSRKKKLESDKRQLEKRSPRHYESNGSKETSKVVPSEPKKEKFVEPEYRSRDDQIKRMQENSGLCLNIFGSEETQKKVKEEEKKDFQDYLAQKRIRGGLNSENNIKKESERQQSIEEYKSMVDANYSNLLREKEREEHSYNTRFNHKDDVNKNKSKKKTIVFDSDEEDLFKQVMLEKKKRLLSAEGGRRKKNLSERFAMDGRSSSVPLNISKVFGGSSLTQINKEKSKQYKKDLEEQIREREEMKMREKLKRMGRINSNMDVMEVKKIMNPQQFESKETSPPKPESLANLPTSVSNQLPPQPQHIASVPSPMYYPYPTPIIPPMWAAPSAVPNYNGGIGYMPVNQQQQQQQQHSTIQTNTPMQHQNNTRELNNNNLQQTNGNSPVAIPHRPNMHPPGGNSQGLFGTSPSREDTVAKKTKQQLYQEELKRQIEEKQAAAEKEKAKREKYEKRLEEDIATYDPWGKAGCGAPVKNVSGQVVANLRRIQHPINASLEEPSPIVVKALEGVQQSSPNQAELLNLSAGENQAYLRGAALRELQGHGEKSPRDKLEVEDYKMFLQRQVEEKKRKDEELKEKAKMEEMKENERLFEQQRKIKEEYELEKEKRRQKEEEVRKQNEELRLKAGEKRMEEERKRKQLEEEQEAMMRKEAEMKIRETTQKVRKETSEVRTDSPPVPALAKSGNKKRQSQEKRYSYEENVKSNEEQERKKNENYLKEIRKSLNTNNNGEENVAQQEALVEQLAALREHLHRQERKIKKDLEKNKDKYSSMVKGSSKSRNKPLTRDITETMSKQSSKHTMINDDKKYFYIHRNDEELLEREQQEYMRQQESRLRSLRAGLENKMQRYKDGPVHASYKPSNQSLLESDSKFVKYDSSHYGPVTKSAHDSFQQHFRPFFEDDTLSMDTTHLEELHRKNEERLKNINLRDNERTTEKRTNKWEKESSNTTLKADTYFTAFTVE